MQDIQEVWAGKERGGDAFASLCPAFTEQKGKARTGVDFFCLPLD